ncbi:MAG: hypothetical protein HYV63_11425 [Candidatus Schekmanbacteria bacterium]|nr:hypothetical protein [Candidatus Schekmanbacteria bacterium]
MTSLPPHDPAAHASRSVPATVAVPVLAAVLLFALAPAPLVHADVTISPYRLFGGPVASISSVRTSDTTTELYAATTSPNVLFRAIVGETEPLPVFSPWIQVAGLVAGTGQRQAHHLTVLPDTDPRCIFVGVGDGIHYGSENAFSRLADGETEFAASDPFAIDAAGRLFVAAAGTLHRGTVSSDCAVSFAAPIATGLTAIVDVKVGRDASVASTSTYVYLQERLEPPRLARSTDPVEAVAEGTTFVSLAIGDAGGRALFSHFAVDSEGVVWMSGSGDNGNLWVQHTGDWQSWTPQDTGVAGSGGPIFAFPGPGDAATDRLYTSVARSLDGGASWGRVCGDSWETPPRGSAYAADALTSTLLYLSSGQGMATSTSAGARCRDHDEGMSAVRTWQMFTNAAAVGAYPAKSIGWASSSSGVWKTMTLDAAEPDWGVPLFPRGDLQLYWGLAVSEADPVNDAFVGTTSLYATTDGGTSWNVLLSAGDHGFGSTAVVGAIALDATYSAGTAVYAGLSDPAEERAGGFLVTCDGGESWTQVSLANAVPGPDADIADIVLVEESPGVTVTYVSADLVTSGARGPLPVANGLYRITDDCASAPSTWAVVPLLATPHAVNDLVVDAGNTLYAAASRQDGTPVLYRGTTTGLVEVPLDGLFPAGSLIRALTAGDRPDGTCPGLVLYAAVGLNIFYRDLDETCATPAESWTYYVTASKGGAINKLLWDALVTMVDVGLYRVSGPPPGAPHSLIGGMGLAAALGGLAAGRLRRRLRCPKTRNLSR